MDTRTQGILRYMCVLCLLIMVGAFVSLPVHAQAKTTPLPTQIPPRRSSQIQVGLGGVNVELPRPPYLPWNRWWWTRIFDGGFEWVRIGQYEDSSDQTSWDWVEQKRGHLAIPPKVDEYINSLVQNGTKIDLQLLYGNPMYTSPAGIMPNSIIPAPATVHNPDRSLYSIFWPPTTPSQIKAFIRYTKFMVNHFRGRIKYYSLWNEENGEYWNPKANPEQYGRLLKAFVPAVHQTDPSAKVVFGGLAGVGSSFPKKVLETCQCASGIDVFAYHTYPGGYARNVPPESVDYGAFGDNTPKGLRKMIRHFPGIRPDIQFWDNEYNQMPRLGRGMGLSVQAKYVPRMMVYNWASGIPTSIWELINDTSSDEGDNFGILRGMMHKAADFTARPVFKTVENTNAMFANTVRDRAVRISISGKAHIESAASAPLFAYAFRSNEGKVIVAYWLGAHSWPGDPFVPYYTTMKLENTGIRHPVLVSILTGKITKLQWASGSDDTLKKLPVLDSVLVIAGESYFDWPVLPETPSSLRAAVSGRSVKLTWAVHGQDITHIVVERQQGYTGRWGKIATLPADATTYVNRKAAMGITSYRVQALNNAGKSAYSNIVNVK